MKRKNLSKVLAVTLCLTFALSTVALAKTVKTTSSYKCVVRMADPLPEDGQVPD